MAKSNSTDFTLNGLDDLFSTQEERDNGSIPEIRDIDISLIDDFPDHPFKVAENEELYELADSIKEQEHLHCLIIILFKIQVGLVQITTVLKRLQIQTVMILNTLQGWVSIFRLKTRQALLWVIMNMYIM